MKTKIQNSVIDSIGENLIENIRDLTNILEDMQDEIDMLKCKVRKISPDKTK